MNDPDDPVIRECAWACSSLSVLSQMRYGVLINYLYSASGPEDCHRVVLLGCNELPLARIRECHRLVLGALANATPKDSLVDDAHPEEEDSRVLALAVTLAAQAEHREPGQYRVGR